MTPMHSAWGLQTLQASLQDLLPGIQVEGLPSATSTNSLLLERARHATPVLLVAEVQTAGRGRMGRAWQAEPGASLTFSVGMPLAPRQWQGLSLAVGLALADALEPDLPAAGLPALGLKWPNDLWHWDGAGRGRKLGGVLIETTSGAAYGAGAAGQRHCVVGVGLNIAPRTTAPGEAATACVQELLPEASPASTLARVAPALLRALLAFQTDGFAPLAPAYARRDLLRGQAVHTSGPPPASGTAAGVDAEGALLLHDGAGLHRIVGGEVSVRFSGTPLPASPALASAQASQPPGGLPC